MSVKTRFCPSPTGLMHLGNYRTALISWLYAKSKHGGFLLRIEDTDKARSEAQYSDQLQQDLLILGLKWDQGPNTGADSDKYFQSKRGEIYAQIYTQLLESGKAYHCFCSPDKLKAISKQQLAAGQPPRYLGTCRSLSSKEVENNFANGLTASLRFVVPSGQEVLFDDAIRGTQTFASDDLGDFIIRKTDASSSFMFCNAIDDALMEVTTVVRGEDHLTNTPRQLLILQELGLNAPAYAHISIILGDDGAPLSKRNGSESMNELLRIGYLPQAINNYIARLGNSSYGNDDQLLSLEQLAGNFDINKLSKSAAKFDIAHLKFWQKKALRSLDIQQITEWITPHITCAVPSEKQELFWQTMGENIILPGQANSWSKILFTTDSLTLDTQILAVDAAFFSQCSNIAKQYSSWEDFIHQVKQQGSYKGKSLFHALRMALSGRLDGPELKTIFNLLAKDQLALRFEKAAVAMGN
jgi:nondiscriminating glutamyl-tRNA synthetase